MYCIAKQVVLPPLTEEERKALVEKAALLSVYAILDAVPDPRKRQGLRYELAFLLTCLLAALLCNCNSTEAVGQWCREHVEVLRQVFGARLFLTPTGSLYRKLLPRLDVQALEEVLGRWIQATLHAVADEPIALDGKTVRGARTDEQAAPHLLSFCTHESQETLFQVRVSEKTNEIPVAKAVLPTLPVAGRVVTCDALHTHADLMQITHDHQGKSVFTVKGNQPTLYDNLATYFADPQAVCQQAETWDRRRGRVEHRVMRVSTEMNGYLAPEWPLVAQVAQVRHTVTCKGQTSTEVVYLITDLSPTQAAPLRLLSGSRPLGHRESLPLCP
ncbi:MAG TPA: ISAs1 family transposase [Ktedonobacteraceae bacterium]|nr:ISAs1 family transposase [Ktedonobacteraceae bacterium]